MKLNRKEKRIKMISNIRYVVTKGSEDGTFREGDHIYIQRDNSILCVEAGGWTKPEDFEKATKGMKVKIDKDNIRKHYERLKKELEELETLEKKMEEKEIENSF